MIVAGLLAGAGCSGSTPVAVTTVSPSSGLPSPSAATPGSAPSATATATATASPSPSPSTEPSQQGDVACRQGAGAGSIVLVRGWYAEPLLMYDVTDPVHPRLLCTISNTSAHLFTADTFQYLKPVSTTETDVMLRSLGSGNESVAARLPFAATSIAWLTDLSVAAYMVAGPSGFEVWLYSQQKSSLVFTFQEPGVGCICRFGLPGQTLAISPDGQYLLAGPGVGTPPLAVYRVSDRARVATLSTSPAFWDRTGHRLFVAGGSAAAQTWTPEGGFAALRSAAQWPYFPGESPDGSQVVYTAYSDTGAEAQPRVYSYDVKAASTRMLIDRMRTQVVFVKDGWAWYLEEATCDPATCNVPFSTMPTGNVFAMQLSTGTEVPVVFAAGENPVLRTGSLDAASFGSAEYWPNT